MRTKSKHLLWLLLTFLLAGCKASPTALPELVTLQAPKPTQALVLTATALPEGRLTPVPSLPVGPTPTPKAGWCDRLEPAPAEAQGRLRVALVKDRDVWVWDQGDQARRLTYQGDVESVFLSGDGLVVAYLRAGAQGTQELWRVNATGEEQMVALSASYFERMRDEPEQIGVVPFNLTWIEGTQRLAFNTYPLLPGEGLWSYVPDDLWVVDLQSLEVEELLRKGKGGHFSISPDGRLAAVFSPKTLDIINTDGSAVLENVLEGFHAIGLGEYYSYPSLKWSPDSQILVVAIPSGEDPFQPEAGAAIWKVPMDGSQPVLVKNVAAFLSQVAFSPDLSILAYFHQPDMRSSGVELHFNELDGDEDYLLFRGELVERVQWLPDSRHFLYWLAEAWQPTLGHICQDAGKFPEFTIRSDISWVDAERFLFLTGEAENWELFLGELSGELMPIAELGESSAFAFSLAPAE